MIHKTWAWLGCFLMLQAGAADFVYLESLMASVPPANNESEINSRVKGLREGDVVSIQNAKGQISHRFRLGRYLGGGEGGRVFYSAGVWPPRAVKFQLGGVRARKLMEEEVEAMKALERKKIPHAKMLFWNSNFFVEKQYVEGPTLKKLCQQWNTISKNEQLFRIRQLAVFLKQLQSAQRRFADIHWGNIKYDTNDKIWKVIDPGKYTYDQPDIHRIYESLRKEFPSIFSMLRKAEGECRAIFSSF